MSKNIRVAWDDLQPGDKVHLKGSRNVYEFLRKYDVGGEMIDAFVVSAPGIFQVAVPRINFDYATRPAPKKPKLRMPEQFGEYWIYTPVSGWLKMLYTETPFPHGYLGDLSCPQHGVYTVYDRKTYQTNRFSRIRALFNPTEILTAEEYYTRKAKGEL